MTALHDGPRAADRLDVPALTPDDLRVIQQRYAVHQGALTQIQINHLAAAALYDVPRLLAALQQLQSERDAAEISL